jgi:N-acetyl sugar amidotransferase
MGLNVLNDDKIKTCSKCLLPETQETITYDDGGVCNVCRQHEFKKEKIDWAQRKVELDRLIEEHRGKGSYDCLVPFSGGKDSTFALLHLVKNYKVKPLVVTFDHGFMRPTVLANTERIIKTLGVDYLKFRPNWQIVKRLMLETLRRKGDFCWHCHTGIFSYPMQIAVKFKVPLIFWGEPSAEYTSYYGYDETEEVDERRFNRFVNLGITAEDMLGMLGGDVTMRDLEPFTYPSIKDLRALKFRSVCLGSFIPWDVKEQIKLIKKELGWQEDEVEGIPPEYGYEKIECAMQGVRDYLKFIKRGFGRTAHLASLDIRNGRLSTEKAKEMILKHDGKRPASLDIFLKYVGLTEAEFNEIAMTHVVAPHVHDPSKVEKGKPLHDQSQWDRTS